MAEQLAWGADAALRMVLDDLRDALAAMNDAHEAMNRNPGKARDSIEDAIDRIYDARDRLEGDIRDRLKRAKSRADEQGLAAQVAELKQVVEELQKQKGVTPWYDLTRKTACRASL